MAEQTGSVTGVVVEGAIVLTAEVERNGRRGSRRREKRRMEQGGRGERLQEKRPPWKILVGKRKRFLEKKRWQGRGWDELSDMMGLDGSINEKREKKAGMMDLILLVNLRFFFGLLEALEKNLL